MPSSTHHSANSASNVESTVYTQNSSQWSSGSECDKYHGKRRSRRHELTVVTTPWYPDGVLKDSITLGGEIVALNKLMQLTAKERALRGGMRSTLQEGASKIWGNSTMKVYGSYAYDCALPDSTLDFVCEDCEELAGFEGDVRQLGEGILTVEHVFKCNVDGENQAFARFRDAGGITANVTFFEGKSPARMTVLQIRKKFDEFPAARFVYDVVRMVLRQSGCADPGNNGLSSYAMLLMLFHVCTQSKNVLDPGQLLVDFFTLYSHPFNYIIDPNALPGAELEKANCLYVKDITGTANVAAECNKGPALNSVCKACSGTLSKWASGKWVGYRGRSPLSSILAYDTLWDRTEQAM